MHLSISLPKTTLCTAAGVGGGLGRVRDGRRDAEPFPAARLPARAGNQPLSGALPLCSARIARRS